MKMKQHLLWLIFLISSLWAKAQAPQTPVVNWAVQYFQNMIPYELVRSQNISPRVMKPAHPSPSEKIVIEFIGNWLDITDEVIVTGPGVSSSRGVTAGSIRGANGQSRSNAISPVIRYYNGPYVRVEFFLASDAALGTHTVRLRRPRLGMGKDEAVFYIEVYDVVRIHDISMGNHETVNKGYRATVRIKGSNLDRITSIGDCNGMFSNITNFQKSATEISFAATAIKSGILDYTTLMNSVLPINLKNAEYPRQMQYPDVYYLKVE